MAKNTMQKVGMIAFLIGIVASIILGLLKGFGVTNLIDSLAPWMVVVGLLIGLLNITADEAVPLMVAALVLGAGSLALSQLAFVGAIIAPALLALGVVVLPAAGVVAIKVIYDKAKN